MMDCREERRLKPYTISPKLHVPSHIQRPPYVDTGEMPWGEKPEVHNPEVSHFLQSASRVIITLTVIVALSN